MWPMFKLPRSRLLVRLVFVNMIGVFVLAIGMLLVSETRQTLVEAHKQNLLAQARLTASALSDAASERSFQFLPGPSLLGPLLGDRMMPEIQILQAADIMRRLAAGANSRARLYGRDGALLVDSEAVSRDGTVVFQELPPLQEETAPSYVPRIASWVRAKLNIQAPPLLTDAMALNGSKLQEVRFALQGRAVTSHRRDEAGRDIYTVAVPVQAYRAIIGAVMVSSRSGELEAIIFAERRNIFELMAIAFLVSLVVSYLLARTISLPVSRIAAAARAFAKPAGPLPAPTTLPDLSGRADEIGDLSIDMRLMVTRLLERLNAIDQFAADVAHELKNPLTSLHSAVQSLTAAKTVKDRDALVKIIEQDVARLNRLISDISAASRLDAALAREEIETFDLGQLAADMVEARATTLSARFDVVLISRCEADMLVRAQKAQISQVIDNLISNAASFSPSGGRVTLTVRPTTEGPSKVELNVVDEGPGLTSGTEERIFERFYSDRHHARQDASEIGHSGLGLSISRQIARVYGGDLIAFNRPDENGAVFRLILPREVM